MIKISVKGSKRQDKYMGMVGVIKFLMVDTNELTHKTGLCLYNFSATSTELS
jgi:hypothetical protein